MVIDVIYPIVDWFLKFCALLYDLATTHLSSLLQFGFNGAYGSPYSNTYWVVDWDANFFTKAINDLLSVIGVESSMTLFECLLFVAVATMFVRIVIAVLPS